MIDLDKPRSLRFSAERERRMALLGEPHRGAVGAQLVTARVGVTLDVTLRRKWAQTFPPKPLILLVSPSGFEPETY